MKPVFLYSDLLFFALIALVVVFLFCQRNNPNIQHIARLLKQNAVAVSSATILSAFLLVAVLDSLHFRPKIDATHYSVNVLSALDFLTTHLRENVEKSYSTPFAIRLLTLESVENENGEISRVAPRLQFGGAHLENEAEKGRDIAFLAAIFISCGIGIVVVIFLLWRIVCGIFQKKWRFTVENRAFWLTFAFIVVFFVFLGGFSFFYHPLGTDKVGQDVLYQILKSVRVAVLIGLLTTFILLPLAVLLGVVAGYFRGFADDAIQYLYTVLNAVPSVLLIAAAILMMQVLIDSHPAWFQSALERADLRFLALCAILGITSWTTLCRLLRSETLKLAQLEYVAASRAFGASNAHILWRHILPNLSHIIIITVVMDFSSLVLAEAVLSYVGIGVDPMMMSFGTLINNARLELGRDPVVWWLLASAFFAMLLLVLSANLFADALRQACNPREL